MTLLPSVQARCVRLRAIDDDTLFLADGRPRAIFAIEPPNLQLAGPAELETWVEQLAAFLRGLEFPVQLVYRLAPADLEPIAARVERAGAQRGGRLAAIGREHAAFLRHLARTREPLEPRLYIVCGLEGARGSLLEQVVGWLRQLGRRKPRVIQAPLRSDTQLLDDRATQLALALDHLGANPMRLESAEIALLFGGRLGQPESATRPRSSKRHRSLESGLMALLTIRRRHSQPGPAPAPGPGERVRLASVIDAIAPESVEVARDWLRLGDTHAAGLAVTGLPRSVQAGQLAPVCALGLECDLSVHVHPVPTGTARRFLLTQATRHRAGQLASPSTLGDPARDTALEDAQRLRLALERGQERLFRAPLYGVTRAGSPSALRDRQRHLAEALEQVGLRTRRTVLQQLQAFRSCLPQLTNELDDEHYLDSSSLAALLPWSRAQLQMPGGFLWGLTSGPRTPVLIDPFANPPLRNANVVVFAQTGSGKSFLLKLLVRRALAHGIDVIVIDEASQEYLPLCQDLGEQGQYVHLGARGVRVNPFELPPVEDDADGDTDRASLAREHVGSSLLPVLELLLGRLTEEERAILDLALVATYAACTRAHPAHGRPAGGPAPARPQPPQDRLLRDADPALLRGLAVRLARWVEGALGELFSGPTTVALDRPLTVVNLASLGSTQLPMGIHLLNSFVFTRVRQAKAAGRWRPTLLVQDEAWSILQHPAGGTFLNGLARKARKYWLGLISASQSPADCLKSELGAALVDSSATWVLLGLQATALEAGAEVLKLSPAEARALEAAAPGQALVHCAGARVLAEVVASREEERLATTKPEEVAERERLDRSDGRASPPSPPMVSSVSQGAAAVSGCRNAVAVAEGATRRTLLFGDLFADVEPEPGDPIPLASRRRRTRL